MDSILLDDPRPDFEEFVKVLKGEKKPQRLHIFEIGIDAEVCGEIAKRYRG